MFEDVENTVMGAAFLCLAQQRGLGQHMGQGVHYITSQPFSAHHWKEHLAVPQEAKKKIKKNVFQLYRY